MKKEENIKWFGSQLHLCVKCDWHTATVVNDKYLISTVGDWYNANGERDEVGVGRFYETMVFEIEGYRKCGCPNVSSFEEVDFEGYNTCKEATQNHMLMIDKWAKKR